ncbi:UNVERIFIED_CONTAM: hypothetical protein RMT77_004554 [Armadillidium vulgare]
MSAAGLSDTKAKKPRARKPVPDPLLTQESDATIVQNNCDLANTQFNEQNELRTSRKVREAKRNRLSHASTKLEDLLSSPNPSASLILTISQMLESISLKLDESDEIIHNTLDGASYIADDAECYKIQRTIRNQINMATEYLNSNKK